MKGADRGRTTGYTVFSILMAIVLGACASGPRVYSWFGDRTFNGMPRLLDPNPHSGLDVAANVGDPVIAAADGEVIESGPWPTCGTRVTILHREYGSRTRYCHMALDGAADHGPVKRGDVVGYVARLGTIGRDDPSHVHFELIQSGFVDPTPHIVGCFDAHRVYPSGQLVLTWPVRC